MSVQRRSTVYVDTSHDFFKHMTGRNANFLKSRPHDRSSFICTVPRKVLERWPLASKGRYFPFENVLTGRLERPFILHVFIHLSQVYTSLGVKQ